MKNFQHKVRRFREFFTTKGSLNLLNYLPFPSSNTKKDKSLSKLPRCSPHLAGPLKPFCNAYIYSSRPLLCASSSFPPPFDNLYPSLSIEMKALNLEIHRGISSRLRFRDSSCHRCLRVGEIVDFCFVSRKGIKKKGMSLEKRNFIPWLATPRGGVKRMGLNRENKITWERIICVFGFMCFLWTPHGSQTL